MSEVGSAYVSIIPSFQGFGAKLASQLSAQTAGLGEKVGQSIGQKIGTGLSSAGASTAAFGRKLSTHVTLPILGIGAAAFKVFSDFDQTMRQTGVLTGQTGDALKGMTDLAIKMGRDTSFSAGQAADAMLSLAKGGMSAAQIKGGALSETLTLAAAGGLDLGEAATTMSDTLNTFGLAAADSAKVAAALAGGANASSASVQSLTQALAQVGPGARSAGLDVNDTVAALSLFANSGIKGSDAGTSLKTMLTRLVPATKKAADTMKAFGLDFTDAHGNIKPLSDVAQQLHDKLGPLSAEQRTLAMTTIFGTDATRAATVLMNSGAAGVVNMTAKTKDLSAAQKLAKTNTEGAKGSIEQMMGSIETAGIVIGKTLAPSVISLAEHVTGLVNAFTQLNPRTQGLILKAAGLAAALGPVLLITGKLVQATGQTILGVTKAAGAFASTAKATGGFITGLSKTSGALAENASGAQKFGKLIGGKFSTAFGAMGKAVGAVAAPLAVARKAVIGFTASLLANPVFLIVAALVALVAIAVVLYKKWTPFRELVDTVGRALRDFGATAVVGAIAAFRALAGAFTTAWAAIKTAWAVVLPIFASVLDAITQPLQGIIATVRGFVSVLVGIFTGDLGKIVDGVAMMVGGVVRFFLGLPARVFAAVAPLVPGLLAAGTRALAALASAVVVGAVAVWSFFTALPGRAAGLALVLVPKLTQLGTAALAAMARAVVAGAVALWTFFTGLPSRATGLATTLGPRLAVLGRAALVAMAGAVAAGAVGVWTFFRELPAKVLAHMGNLGSKLMAAGLDLILGLIVGIRAGAARVAQAARDVVSGAIKAAKDALAIGSPSRVFAAMGRNTMDGFALGIESQARQVERTVRAVMNRVTDVDPTLRIAPVTALPRTSRALTPATGSLLDRVGGGGPLIGTAVLHEQVDVDVLARRLDFALSGASLGTGVSR